MTDMKIGDTVTALDGGVWTYVRDEGDDQIWETTSAYGRVFTYRLSEKPSRDGLVTPQEFEAATK